MSSKHTTFTSKENIILLIIDDVINILLLWWWSVPIVACMQLVSMKTALFLIVFYFHHCDGMMELRREPTVLNDRPIIGILSQEQHYRLIDKYATENYTSYIAASYVKSVEAAGARVVPIMIGKSREYYCNLMEKINGVVFPGGATYFNQSNGYADAGQHIYEIAKEMNDAGDHFPIFGTCLGFELLLVLAMGRTEPDIRTNCNAFGNRAINFTRDFRTSKMFQDIDNDFVDLLQHQNITINAHRFCILDENLIHHGLTDWRVTSHAVDKNGLKYVASIEHKRYPFYGVQFHPEKTAFEWKSEKKYAHSQNAIKVNRYFMDFFVYECRQNLHSFGSEAEDNNWLIYNYAPTFTGLIGSEYNQCYFFEPRGIVSKL